jgi:hypothetical protein
MSYDDGPDGPRQRWKAPTPVLVLLAGLAVVGVVLYVRRAGDQRERREEAEKVLRGLEGQFGGVTKLAFEDLPRSREAAESFLKDLRAGRLDAAHAAATDAFRARMSRKALEEFTRVHPALKPAGKREDGLFPGGIPLDQDTHQWWFAAEGLAGGPRPTFVLTVVRSGGGWKVDSLAVREEGKGPPPKGGGEAGP